MRPHLCVLVPAAALWATCASASTISVTLDEVRTITFGKPVSTVYVGNPAIADINMIDSRHAFVLGKGYGSTNIVALNHDGEQIANTHIRVLANINTESTVTLNRGTDRETLACTANHCEPSPQPGDGSKTYADANAEISSHQDTARKAASASQ